MTETTRRRSIVGLAVLATLSLIVQYGFALPPVVQRRWLALDVVLAVGLTGELVWWTARHRFRVAAFRTRGIEWALLALLPAALLLVAADGAGHGDAVVRRFGAAGAVPAVVQAYLLASVLVRALHDHARLLSLDLRPVTLLVGSFATLVGVGTLLLSLPRASADPGRPFGLLDALFTATSAACVTGLTVREVGTDLAPIGQAVVLVLMQIGGLGIATFVVTLSAAAGQRLSVPQMVALREMLNTRALADVRSQFLTVAGWALVIELTGAVLLFLCWPVDGGIARRVGWSVFHAVSAFCNAGLTLTVGSLAPVGGEPAVLLVVMALIVLGGVGFPVLWDVGRRRPEGRRRRLRVQSRLALVATAVLLAIGTLGYAGLERHALLRDADVGEATLLAAFHAVTARTAGFQVGPLDVLAPATSVLLVVLMAIGAGPVSTGGGIKTVTMAVLILEVRAILTGRPRVEVFGRTVSSRALGAATAVFVLYLLAAVLVTFALAAFEPQVPVGALIFEAVSALSTVGLTTGITPELGTPSRLVLCLAMFAGRVGPLALAMSVLGGRRPHATYELPEEDVVVG